MDIIREEDIDEMHNLDVLQASSAGRKTGADSPPFDVNTGPRQPMVKRDTQDFLHGRLRPSVPLRQPYPPVKYEWEETNPITNDKNGCGGD